jgi:hypothetical protein
MAHPMNARTKHWVTMTIDEQHCAIRQLRQGGFGLYEIANACSLSIEQVRAVLEATPPEAPKALDPARERMSYEDWLEQKRENEI